MLTNSPTDENPMKVFLKTTTGKTITLNVYPQTTVLQLQGIIQEKEGIPPDQQMLVYGGKGVKSYRKELLTYTECTLSDNNIKADSTLHLLIRVRGGGGALMADCVLGEPENTTRNLEVGPGGVITQVFIEDDGNYKWNEEPVGELVIHIVDPTAYKSITKFEPEPPQSPLEKATKMKSVERNPDNGDEDVMSIAQHHDQSPTKVNFLPIHRSLEPDITSVVESSSRPRDVFRLLGHFTAARARKRKEAKKQSVE
ncbi:ubiquitin-related domain-containing protein [Xylariales sp. PMI_506]|nr:ubiquitin-related domain-containing protein [Xylariales sp. PMI_506]